MPIEVEGWYERDSTSMFTNIYVEAYDTDQPAGHLRGGGIGYVIGGLHNATGSAIVNVADLDSAYQGRGIGKRMYKEFIDTAFRAGAKRVYSSPSPSVQARHVWESLDRESKKVSKAGPMQWVVVRRRPNVKAHRRSR
jgi:GNAT superfamily N-acetyltransferase